jgi:hypothetical protein
MSADLGTLGALSSYLAALVDERQDLDRPRAVDKGCRGRIVQILRDPQGVPEKWPGR